MEQAMRQIGTSDTAWSLTAPPGPTPKQTRGTERSTSQRVNMANTLNSNTVATSTGGGSGWKGGAPKVAPPSDQGVSVS